MKYCQHCGSEVNENAVVCVKCGCQLSMEVNGKDDAGCFLLGLCFMIPLAGWILYFVWKDSFPKRAGACAKWGWIGFGIGMVLNIFYWIIVGIALSKHW